MKLFEMKNFNLQISEEVWGYIPFKKILNRDRSKNKEKAFKDMLFIWNFCDIKSDYNYITNEKDRILEIKKDIGLPETWKFDKTIKEAVAFYNKFMTVTETLYRGALKAAYAVNDYLENAKNLLNERDVSGKPTTDISKITGALDKIPKIISNLKNTYKEVLKEKEELLGKKKGNRSFNMFEDGL